MNRFLIWLGETFAQRKKLIINDPCGAGPYLTRYYMLGHRTSKWALMLHRFHRSDLDRDLHDHPWPFWSLILTGGYWEQIPLNPDFPAGLRQKMWHPAGSLLRRPASWTHRVMVNIRNIPVWTLVLRFGYERQWGFHTRNGWINFRDYDYKAGCE